MLRKHRLLTQSLFSHQLENYVSNLTLNRRESMNFVELFLDYTKAFESPTSFWQWSAVSMLSATMRDNVYVQWGQLKIYPNLYIMLLADSGACRKGAPLQTAMKFLKEIDNTKLITGRSSIQGILQELAKQESGSTGMMQKKGASALLYAEEFAASLVNDPAVIHILTDLYDYKESTNIILRDSTVKLSNVCFGMLVATNSTMLQELYNNTATEGGLIGRTIVIHEKKRRHKNSMVFSEKKTEEDRKPILNHLRALSKIRGEIETTEAAKQYYDEWYRSIDDEIEDKTGFMHRVHVGVAKVAIALAAAEDTVVTDSKIVVTETHISEAIHYAWKIKENQQALTMGQGKSSNATQMRIFLLSLAKAKNYQMTRREILLKHFADFDGPTLETVVTTLEGGGMIRTTSILNETGYQLTERCRKEVLNHEIKGQAESNGKS